MKRTIGRSVLALAALLSAIPGISAELKGVKLPDQASVGGKELILNGLGIRQATMFKVDVYVGALYLQSKSANPAQILGSDGIKRVTLAFVRDLDRGKLVEAFGEGVKENCRANCDALKPGLQQLDAALTDVKSGDRLSIDFYPDKVVVHNPRLPGAQDRTIGGAAFSRGLLAVWLGDHPPTDELKSGMLGAR